MYAGGWIMTKLTPLDRMFLRSIGLNHAEASSVCEALQAGVTSPQGDFLWREVELAIRRDGLDAKYEIDGPASCKNFASSAEPTPRRLREQSPVSGKCAVCHPFSGFAPWFNQVKGHDDLA